MKRQDSRENLLALSLAERDEILAAAAALAETSYLEDEELTGYEVLDLCGQPDTLDHAKENRQRKMSYASLKPKEEYRVLSVQPPWAWAIMFAGKDIENRTWTTRHRGPLIIHASSKQFSKAGLEEVRRELARCTGRPLCEIPVEFPRSQLLGLVELVDIVDEHDSPWAYEGNWFWVLRDPRPLSEPVLGVNGKLGLWRWESTDAK